MTLMLEHRTYAQLAGEDTSKMVEQVVAQQRRVADRMAAVRSVVAVMSGKGGVGKSLITAALAASSAARGKSTGLLDADLVGPSAARLSGVERAALRVRDGAVDPPASPAGVRVMSMELVLEDGAPLAWREPGSDSFVWRSAQERSALREFVADIRWGELELLVVDLPPGTQRLVDLNELLPALAGVLVVTNPGAVAAAAVDRSMALARDRGIDILGVVENMSGYACASCGELRPLFPGTAGADLAEAHGAPLLATVPFDPPAAELADRGAVGDLLSTTAAGHAIDRMTDTLLAAVS